MINRFEKEYNFLSNFYFSPFKDHNKQTWPTVEHYFQAKKVGSPVMQEIIREQKFPSMAKHLGQCIRLRSDWENVKNKIMQTALKYKFIQNEILQIRLSNTYPKQLIEGNFWHDNYWGDCLCSKCFNIKGQNHLGKLLMELRQEIYDKNN